MLNLQVNSILKVLTVNEHGVCEDGRSWVRCTAMSFFDDDNKVITLSAFGHYADMILDNHSGSNMRRAMVSGELIATVGKVSKTKTVNGVPITMMIPEVYYQIVADTVRFIDKSNLVNEEEYEATSNAIGENTIIDFCDDEDEIAVSKPSKNDKEVTFTDADDEEEKVKRPVRARDRKPRKSRA